MTAETITKGQRKTRYSKRTEIIPKQKAIELAARGELTQEKAGELCGYSQKRISELIQDYKSNPDTILFINNKDKAFESLQSKIVNSIGDDDLKKASLSQKVLATAVLNDKIQLLRGEATSIQAVDIRGLIGCVIKSQETGKVEGEVIDIEESNPE